MSRLYHTQRLLIWLLVASLWLPACGLLTSSENTPPVSQEAEPLQEASSEIAVPDQPGSTILLPVIIAGDEAQAECLAAEAQIMASSIAVGFQTTSEQVLSWYCAGFPFEDILLALQSAADMQLDPAELLARLEQGQTWDEIWKDIGLLK